MVPVGRYGTDFNILMMIDSYIVINRPTGYLLLTHNNNNNTYTMLLLQSNTIIYTIL